MGRYTTEQTYTDKAATVGTVPYEVVKEKEEAAPAPAEASKESKESKERFKFNRVDNVAGSTAGAGSGEFHMYRAARRREMERVGAMEAEHKKKMEDLAFQEKRKRAQAELEEKTRQKAAKRRRKQENAKVKKMMGADATKDEPLDVTPDVMPGGVPEIPNDGSFLAKLLAQQAAKDATPSTDAATA
ncbi:hypothetical protein SPRG_03102 [Saprolegnia parasitica CBS 223.65]|uniref:Casein kinase substrate phosphoprotein PP28 domain-containing protein n=1 Tax=Saprolegnia parasitica (strain CBS 223.65) TaxID=695850 RepID=A0A067CZD8_SAPPC|nr:hypothetical protein SPRG_03102 [Saprolegnia parasitica CBS 223.65]KDO31886.1 hypothetical protein SPRG_03102 [Saprolegnia parasitica CBS 223.65]|eukprot:XP_012197085.1 hypothetical protein SPRG_03102 [Saprolegnia parasitica CBS 223.65]